MASKEKENNNNNNNNNNKNKTTEDEKEAGGNGTIRTINVCVLFCTIYLHTRKFTPCVHLLTR